jgi:hypothetical protein
MERFAFTAEITTLRTVNSRDVDVCGRLLPANLLGLLRLRCL